MMKTTKAPDAASNEDFVTLLRRHRMARGLTQTALAKKLDLSPSAVSLWESGDFMPKASLIPKLARLLGIDPMELTRIIEPESQRPAK